MQLSLGDKIRELRRRDGRTQENLAEALGVTSQAVSRWESGGSYPDVEIIPSIANYFGITIDELFGYQSDREEKIKAILAKADEAFDKTGGVLGKDKGDFEECVAMLRAAAEEFPNEPRIMVKLADNLNFLGWQMNGAKSRTEEGSDYINDDVAYNEQNVYWQESLRICEKLWETDAPEEYREATIFSMIMLYGMMGQHEKAKTLAKNQQSVTRCKEVLLARAATGEEMDRYQGEGIIDLLSQLKIIITNSVLSKTSVQTTEYGRQVLLALVNLYETIFSDGRCGREHKDISFLYQKLAIFEARCGGDMNKAIGYFDKMFEHDKEYCRICDAKEYNYSAPLVSKVIVPRERHPFTPVPENFWDGTMAELPEELCGELRKIEKYKECFTCM